MARRLTGFTPSGDLHLGNLIGAIRPIVEAQRHAADPADTVIFVSDLHALTLEHDPATVRRRTLEFAKLLLAAGTDPDRCIFHRGALQLPLWRNLYPPARRQAAGRSAPEGPGVTRGEDEQVQRVGGRSAAPAR